MSSDESVSLLPCLSESVTALGHAKEMAELCVQEKTKHKKANLECVTKLKVEREDESWRGGDWGVS